MQVARLTPGRDLVLSADVQPRYRRAAGLVDEVVDGRAILIGVDGSEIITLNPVGTIVWHALESETTASSIVDVVADAFPGHDRDEISRDVDQFLAELVAGGLVEAAG
jgi:hypothetical protein